MPRISVIVPAYNCALYLGHCLNSILAQTVRDWEVILIDDGSSDGTREIAEQCAAADSRVRLIAQPNSGKPSVARNAGLRAATGDFVCFLDGDDLYDERKLARELAVMDANPDIGCVFHDVRFIDASGRRLAETQLGDVGYLANARDHLKPCGDRVYLSGPGFYGFMSTEITGMHTSAVMLRRSAIDPRELHFPEDLEIGEDIDLWFRVAKATRVAFVNEELSYYRQHGASITKQHERSLLGSIAAHTRNLHRAKECLSGEQLKRYRGRIARQHRYLGYFYLNECRTAEARLAYRQSLELDFCAPALFDFAKTFVPRSLIDFYRRAASL